MFLFVILVKNSVVIFDTCRIFTTLLKIEYSDIPLIDFFTNHHWILFATNYKFQITPKTNYYEQNKLHKPNVDWPM